MHHAVNLIQQRMVRDTAFRQFIAKLEGQITSTAAGTLAAGRGTTWQSSIHHERERIAAADERQNGAAAEVAA